MKLNFKHCEGGGFKPCKRCADNGKWNNNWMAVMFTIEGYEGCYCYKCLKEIEKENEE